MQKFTCSAPIKYAIGVTTTQALNPSLVYAVVSPWGLEGEERNNPGVCRFVVCVVVQCMRSCLLYEQS